MANVQVVGLLVYETDKPFPLHLRPAAWAGAAPAAPVPTRGVGCGEVVPTLECLAGARVVKIRAHL